MMTTINHLLVCFVEECTEVAGEAVALAQRLSEGLTAQDAGSERASLSVELNDLAGVRELLAQNGLVLHDGRRPWYPGNGGDLEAVQELAIAATALAQASCKVMRFGRNDKFPQRNVTAEEKMQQAHDRLMGAVDKVAHLGVELPMVGDGPSIERQREKLGSLMERSRQLGQLASSAT